MSQYLSRFYCGNKDGLCNFVEPIKYEKLINRQFDNLLTDVIHECTGDGKEKGYCCDKSSENMRTMGNKDMEHINKIANGKIFRKDPNGNFYQNQIPLVKTNIENGNIVSIDMCQCGGEPDEYEKCVQKNCKNYRTPTKYEYCKLGDRSREFGCYGDSQKECEVGLSNPEMGMVHTHAMRIKNLLPDCYLNECNKRMINGSLENTANYNPENQYFAFRNEEDVKQKDSVKDYLLIDKTKEIKNNSNKVTNFSIGSMLRK